MGMKSINFAIAAMALGLSLIVAGAGAYAGESRDSPTDESRALSSAKISMSQALTAAELATGGKAVGTGVEDQDGDVHFEVTILKDNVRQKVLVDTQTGQVVKIVLADDGDEGGSEN